MKRAPDWLVMGLAIFRDLAVAALLIAGIAAIYSGLYLVSSARASEAYGLAQALLLMAILLHKVGRRG